MKSNHDSNELSPNSFARHAPKVWGLISKVLNDKPEEAAAGQRLSELFDTLVTKKLLEHPGIRREAGVSFNPRPARHLEIILREAANSDSHIWLTSLMTILLEHDPTALLPQSELIPARDTALMVLQFERAPGLESIDDRTATILLSRSLDNLRHAHMADQAVLSLDQTLLIADALLTICRDKTATGKLPLLVGSAVERIKLRVKR